MPCNQALQQLPGQESHVRASSSLWGEGVLRISVEMIDFRGVNTKAVGSRQAQFGWNIFLL